MYSFYVVGKDDNVIHYSALSARYKFHQHSLRSFSQRIPFNSLRRRVLLSVIRSSRHEFHINEQLWALLLLKAPYFALKHSLRLPALLSDGQQAVFPLLDLTPVFYNYCSVNVTAVVNSSCPQIITTLQQRVIPETISPVFCWFCLPSLLPVAQSTAL